MYDVVMIGGGAAGLALSVMLKQRAPQLKTAVMEQLDRVGKKLSVTGNGRCNISNRDLSASHFHTRSPETAERVLSSFDSAKTRAFFSSIGVEWIAEDNKLFPRSLQASSVVDALRFSADRLGVETFCGQKVTAVSRRCDGFTVTAGDFSLSARCAVIATGGLAGGGKLGSDGDGYAFLSRLGHRIIPQSPVIVQVKTENQITRQLKGIKINCAVTVRDRNQILGADSGEVLFSDYGLSGPPILQLSRSCKPGGTVCLDLLPEYSADRLTALMEQRRNLFKGLPLTEFFAGLLHKRLGQAVIKACSLPLSQNCNTLSTRDCAAIAEKTKHFCFSVTGNTGFANAQVTAGGGDLTEFDFATLMSKKVPGLFAVGETLDVDGDCGGYNLQWAWSSAAVAASGIIKYLSEIHHD